MYAPLPYRFVTHGLRLQPADKLMALFLYKTIQYANTRTELPTVIVILIISSSPRG